MAKIIPPPEAPAAAVPQAPGNPVLPDSNGRARIHPERERSECLEAWAFFVEQAMMLILYAHHPQDAYNELIDVYGVSEDAQVNINRAEGADRYQPEGPTMDQMLDDLGLFGQCRECYINVNKDRVAEDARWLAPVYYRPLGAIFCCAEHQSEYLRRWRKSRH